MLGLGMQDRGATAGARNAEATSPLCEVDRRRSLSERHRYPSGGARRGSGVRALSSPASRTPRPHPGRGVHFFSHHITPRKAHQ